MGIQVKAFQKRNRPRKKVSGLVLSEQSPQACPPLDTFPE